jgi:hypothetical protein
MDSQYIMYVDRLGNRKGKSGFAERKLSIKVKAAQFQFSLTSFVDGIHMRIDIHKHREWKKDRITSIKLNMPAKWFSFCQIYLSLTTLSCRHTINSPVLRVFSSPFCRLKIKFNVMTSKLKGFCHIANLTSGLAAGDADNG